MKVDNSNWTIEKVQDINLVLGSCVNVALNKKGNIFVVVGLYS
jgi:hypothetical protein